MMNSPKLIGLSSKSVFSGAKGAVITPSVTGAKASKFAPIYNLCRSFERNNGDRDFAIPIMLEIYNVAVDHIMSIDIDSITNWRLPDYEEFLYRQITLMSDGYINVRKRLCSDWIS